MTISFILSYSVRKLKSLFYAIANACVWWWIIQQTCFLTVLNLWQIYSFDSNMTIELTMFWAENGERIPNLPKKVKRRHPRSHRHENSDVTLLRHWFREESKTLNVYKVGAIDKANLNLNTLKHQTTRRIHLDKEGNYKRTWYYQTI